MVSRSLHWSDCVEQDVAFHKGFYRHLAMTLPSQSQFDSALSNKTKTDLAEIFKCRGDPHHWGFVAYQIGPRGCCGTLARSNGTKRYPVYGQYVLDRALVR